jgi:hypothetical protein
MSHAIMKLIAYSKKFPADGYLRNHIFISVFNITHHYSFSAKKDNDVFITCYAFLATELHSTKARGNMPDNRLMSTTKNSVLNRFAFLPLNPINFDQTLINNKYRNSMLFHH